MRVGSDVDPDPNKFWSPGSGSRKAIKTHKNIKSEENSYFEVLDILFWGLSVSPVDWTSFM
jgi:hypothetical protein